MLLSLSDNFLVCFSFLQLQILPVLKSVMPNWSQANFGQFIALSLGLALWLIPILAWYDVFRTWAKDLLGNNETTKNKLIFAIVLTIIVFLIMALFRGLSGSSKTPAQITANNVTVTPVNA